MSKKLELSCALLVATLGLPGCAEMTHLTRTRSMGPTSSSGKHQVFFIDAKQRAIFQRHAVTCAEPSPDALSAIAASQGLSVGTPGGTTVGQSLSIAEAAGAIGLRTQSIQLMRDHMYRVCEAYAAGAIPGLTLQLLHRRFQTTMVGILAIEQLTGVVRAPTVVLGGSSSMGDAQAITQLTSMRETTAASLAEAETGLKNARTAEATAKRDHAAAKSASDAAPDDSAKQATLAEKQADLEKASSDVLIADSTLSGRKAALAAIDRQLVLARSSGSASAGGTIEAMQASRASVDTAAIATAVSSIVNSTMSLSNRDDFCVMVLGEAASITPQVDRDSPVVVSCLRLLQDNRIGVPAQQP